MGTLSNAGRAVGRDREYQIHCRNVLQNQQPSLSSYSGDGIDVQFVVGGTTWTLDVALRTQNGDVTVAECRRRKAAAKQDEIASLAYKVELLRKELRVQVKGVFFVKTALQLGAVRVGEYEGITTAVLSESDDGHGFALAYHCYDPGRERRLRDIVLGASPGKCSIVGGVASLRDTRKS